MSDAKCRECAVVVPRDERFRLLGCCERCERDLLRTWAKLDREHDERR